MKRAVIAFLGSSCLILGTLSALLYALFGSKRLKPIAVSLAASAVGLILIKTSKKSVKQAIAEWADILSLLP